jgi:hypothetical protein
MMASGTALPGDTLYGVRWRRLDWALVCKQNVTGLRRHARSAQRAAQPMRWG